jgi:protein-S-isoprenylcysteine O-methyltransferase Ste14
MNRSTLYFAAASVLLISTWLLYFFLLHSPILQRLVYAGWAVMAAGIVFIVLSISGLRGEGRPESGKAFTHTTTVVESGIYAVVRHPLYLGWSLMYIAVILFSQHWLIVIMGIVGTVCMYLISREEDQHLVAKFGDSYERYMTSVPAMDVLVGIMRILRRGGAAKDQGE